jgi:hypothetical protein
MKLPAPKNVTALCVEFASCLILMAGCSGAPVPGPKSISIQGASAIVGETKFAFWQRHAKQEGFEDDQKIMICVDFNYDETGSGSDEQQHMQASHPDGRKIEWQIDFPEGEKVTLSIDGKGYDLSKGSLFLVTTKGGKTLVRQLNTTLPEGGPDPQGIYISFAKSDPDIVKFVADAARSTTP